MLKKVHFLFPGLALVACSACSTAEPACEDLPKASGTVLHVSQKCGSATGDGSAAKPYATIGQAAAKAKSGTTISVGAGSYAESVTLTGGVSLKGSGSGKTTIAPTDQVGINVTGAGSTSVSDLKVTGATSFGIGSTGTALSVSGVIVDKTQLLLGQGGHGIQADGGALLQISACAVTGNRGVGVLAKGVSTVSIIDPGYAPAPRGLGATAIIDPGFAPASVIGNNQGGGVAIIDPKYSPAHPDSIGGSGAVELMATDVRDNAKFGLAVWGGGAKVTRSAIRGTTKELNADFADGIVIGAGLATSAAKVVVDSGSVVTGNARTGLLAVVKANVSIEGEVSGNESGGVWAQGLEVEVTLAKTARLRENGLVAAAATHGGRLVVDGARIETTKLRPFADPASGMPEEIGDGIGVFKGGSLFIKGATLKDNARAGIVIDQARLAAGGAGLDVAIDGTAFSGSKFGIVVNKGAAGQVPVAALKAKNTFAKVATDVDNAGTLVVRASVCVDKSPDAKSCVATAPAAGNKAK